VNEIQDLREHTVTKIAQFRRIKEIRKIVDDPDMRAAAIRMDWSENAKLFQTRQEKSSYYHDIQVSVNTVLSVHQPNQSVTCVGTLSDETNHRYAAVWTSLISIFAKIGLELENLEELFIITDSPSRQY
jgi:hypothetical protein